MCQCIQMKARVLTGPHSITILACNWLRRRPIREIMSKTFDTPVFFVFHSDRVAHALTEESEERGRTGDGQKAKGGGQQNMTSRGMCIGELAKANTHGESSSRKTQHTCREAVHSKEHTSAIPTRQPQVPALLPARDLDLIHPAPRRPHGINEISPPRRRSAFNSSLFTTQCIQVIPCMCQQRTYPQYLQEDRDTVLNCGAAASLYEYSPCLRSKMSRRT